MMSEIARLPAAADSRQPGEELDIRELGPLFRRNSGLILLLTVLTVIATAVFTYFQDARYESAATLRIDPESQGSNPLAQLGRSGSQGVIETEILVLQSRRMSEAVAEDLHLQVRLSEAGVSRDNFLRVIGVDPGVVPAEYTLERSDDGAWSLRSAAGGLVVDAIVPGQPITFDGVTLEFLPALNNYPEDDIGLEVTTLRGAVAALRSNLDVQRMGGTAQVVSVSYQTEDPQLAADVPNYLVDNFLEYKLATGNAESRGSVEFLRDQTERYGTELELAEQELRDYREAAQLVNPERQAEEQVTRLAEMQAELERLETERAALASTLTRVATASDDANGGSPYRQLASFPVFIANMAVQDLIRTLTELENDRAELFIRLTPEHMDVIAINNRIDELENQLYRMATTYLQGLEAQMAPLQASLGRFETELSRIPASEMEYARRLRQQRLSEEIYTMLQTQLKEAEIQAAIDPTPAELLDSALVPLQPVYPRPLWNLLFALVAGLALGLGTAVARETFDTRVHNRYQALDILRGVPVLAVLPHWSHASVGGSGNRLTRRLLSSGNGKSSVSMNGGSLVTQAAPDGLHAEAYRTLRTALRLSTRDRPPQVIAITSGEPGEGKTTVAANLALAFAQLDLNVALVDADLRAGNLHHRLGTAVTPGLADYLTGDAGPEEIRRTVSGAHKGSLTVVPAGSSTTSPSELLASSRMRKLMSDLRDQFDVVIFDTPATNLVSDAGLLGSMADTSLLVVRMASTNRSSLQHAVEQLSLLNATIGGVVLNDAALPSDAGIYRTVEREPAAG